MSLLAPVSHCTLVKLQVHFKCWCHTQSQPLAGLLELTRNSQCFRCKISTTRSRRQMFLQIPSRRSTTTAINTQNETKLAKPHRRRTNPKNNWNPSHDSKNNAHLISLTSRLSIRCVTPDALLRTNRSTYSTTQ